MPLRTRRLLYSALIGALVGLGPFALSQLPIDSALLDRLLSFARFSFLPGLCFDLLLRALFAPKFLHDSDPWIFLPANLLFYSVLANLLLKSGARDKTKPSPRP